MPHHCLCDKPGGCLWHQAITTKEEFVKCQEGSPPQKGKEPPCIYLGVETTERRRRVHQTLFECRHYGLCTLQENGGRLPQCSNCNKKLLLSDETLRTKFTDPLKITDHNGKETSVLRNLLKDGCGFLVCGGPSLKAMPYERLQERGIFSLGVNNVAAFAKTTAFVCSDPPSKFHCGIFLDPKVYKFLPTPKLSKSSRGTLRTKETSGHFRQLELKASDCPNVWGFERRSWFSPDHSWFTDRGAAWGNHKDGVLKTGEEKTVNTTFLGLRILQYLGARTVFLLGVDFHMNPNAKETENYSFGEKRDAGAIRSNNNLYQVSMRWFDRLKPVFEKFGFTVYNCNPNSALRCFDYVPFDVAIQLAKSKLPPEPWDLSGWYEK